jgi:hypothetical protein
MAVCTNELAFLEFALELTGLAGASQGADLTQLLGPGEMVPLHCRRMETPTAIGARRRSLQFTVQIDQSLTKLSDLAPPLLGIPRVIRPVV